MIDAILGAFGPGAQGLDLYVIDDAATAGGRLIYDHSGRNVAPGGAPGNEAVALVEPYWGSSFHFAGRDWTVITRPSAQLLAAKLVPAGRPELGGGLLLTVLLTLYLVASRTRAERLRHLANTLQREIAVRRSTEEELRLTQLLVDRSSEESACSIRLAGSSTLTRPCAVSSATPARSCFSSRYSMSIPTRTVGSGANVGRCSSARAP